MLLKDKVAVITGGAGLNGLGFATARLMATQGARVVVLDLARAEPGSRSGPALVPAISARTWVLWPT